MAIAITHTHPTHTAPPTSAHTAKSTLPSGSVSASPDKDTVTISAAGQQALNSTHLEDRGDGVK